MLGALTLRPNILLQPQNHLLCGGNVLFALLFQASSASLAAR
ncbi:protein of unknown function [Xenorhabdus bovienii]|uniref:Uncharacterized protein n=1 Tax=Xenorhabdus bovienii TaxID=40576 RepID=A0A0B6X923_XENBV|nr:protein of unknown function [Xenorhabdus bovienii]